MDQIKCPHCGAWNSGKPEYCHSCNHEFNKERKEELEERKTWKDFSIPLIPITPDDHWLLKIIKQFIRINQLIFLGIVYVVVYFAVGFWEANKGSSRNYVTRYIGILDPPRM